MSIPPKITLNQDVEPGITLAAYGSLEFSVAQKTLPSPSPALVASQDTLPYSVVVKNNTERTVIGCTVSWCFSDRDRAQYTAYQTVFDGVRLKGLIGPNAGLIVSVQAPDEVDLMQNQASIVISLEAVMFAGGRTAGKDTSQSIDQMKATLRSEYDLYTSLLDLQNNGGPIVPFLKVTADRFKPGTSLNLRTNEAFLTWYGFYKARRSSALLRLVAERGEAAMLSFVRSELSTKPYPFSVVKP